ncbi:MAG: response regulator [Nitrospirota bacterium]
MKSILIVDDESLILYGLAKSLHDGLTTVATAASGEAALREVSSHPYDLCFLDIHLPDANGVDLMRQIKEISPRTKIAIMTGRQLDDTAKREIEKNAYCFIAKPFDLSQIKAIAKQAFENGIHRTTAEGFHKEPHAGEKRQFERTTCTKLKDCSITILDLENPSRITLPADIIDISEGGVGIQARYPLEPGRVLRFNGIAHQAGIVRWSMRLDSSGTYRLGVQFI